MKNYFNSLRISYLRFRSVLQVPSALAIFSILLVSVATQTLTDIVSKLSSRFLLMGALSVVVVVLFKRWEIPFRKEAASFGQIDDGKLAHRKGLVVLLGLDSNQAVSLCSKLLKQTPEVDMIAFVTTADSRAKGVSDEIINKCIPAILPSKKIECKVYDFANAQSISDSHKSVYDAITWMLQKGLSPSEIVVDITEGRRAMHIGADRAALALKVEVQYLGTQWDHVQNKPIENTQAFKVVSEEY